MVSLGVNVILIWSLFHFFPLRFAFGITRASEIRQWAPLSKKVSSDLKIIGAGIGGWVFAILYYQRQPHFQPGLPIWIKRGKQDRV